MTDRCFVVLALCNALATGGALWLADTADAASSASSQAQIARVRSLLAAAVDTRIRQADLLAKSNEIRRFARYEPDKWRWNVQQLRRRWCHGQEDICRVDWLQERSDSVSKSLSFRRQNWRATLRARDGVLAMRALDDMLGSMGRVRLSQCSMHRLTDDIELTCDGVAVGIEIVK